MAIIVSQVELGSGIVVEDSYVRIDTISGNKFQQSFNLLYFISKDASDMKKEPVKQEMYTFNVSVEDDAVNYHKQGYEYLKGLPHFCECGRCLAGPYCDTIERH